MKNFKLALAVAAGSLAMGGSAMADTVLLSDNFNGENGGVGVLNYNGFANWTVNPQSVDLIGNGYFDFQPGNGLYVDLDGSTNQGGTMTTTNSFVFTSGQTFILEFDLAGNLRGAGNDTVTIIVSIGNENDVLVVPQSQTFTTLTYTFVGNGSTGQVSFSNGGGDNQGALLDNVTLTAVSVPVPQAAGLGLVGMGLIARRRRVVR